MSVYKRVCRADAGSRAEARESLRSEGSRDQVPTVEQCFGADRGSKSYEVMTEQMSQTVKRWISDLYRQICESAKR